MGSIRTRTDSKVLPQTIGAEQRSAHELDQLNAAGDTSSAERDAHRLRNGLIWTSALALLLLAIGLAVPDLRNVLDRVAGAAPGWFVLGVALEIASCLGYVITVRLVLPRGPAREIRRLAWAEMAFGAVVPVGGAGGLAVGAWAMRAWGIAWSRIANRSAVIFLLTSGLNGTVLVLSGLGVWLGIGTDKAGIVYGLVPAAAAFTGLAVFCVTPFVRTSGSGWFGVLVDRTGEWVRDTARIALRPDWRLLGTVGYLLFDVAVLWACLRAVGSHPPLLALLVAYQIGYLANLIPIPGGLGVLEGGLLGALLLYGLPAAPTVAAVVLYHAIALWVPAIGGTIGFVRLRETVAAGGKRLTAVRAGLDGDVNDANAAPAAAVSDLAA
jgi:uncharacterized membrane protein YbhN (UPF0104 family)